MRLNSCISLLVSAAACCCASAPLVPDVVTHIAATRAATTCTSLQGTLGGDIIQLSSGLEYNASATNAWSLYNTDDKPACIVLPRSASDVQVAMAAIFQDKIRYAVQAGGHSAMTGWNTCVNLIAL